MSEREREKERKKERQEGRKKERTEEAQRKRERERESLQPVSPNIKDLETRQRLPRLRSRVAHGEKHCHSLRHGGDAVEQEILEA